MATARAGFTLTEVLMALGLSMFIAAIGFTGIQAFGKAVTRAKQFAAETQMITACLEFAGASADASASYSFANTDAVNTLACPKSWPKPSVSTSALVMQVDTTKADFIGKYSGTNRPPYDAVLIEMLGRMQ
jgi:type II secretory pathway pseudopilin PulG